MTQKGPRRLISSPWARIVVATVALTLVACSTGETPAAVEESVQISEHSLASHFVGLSEERQSAYAGEVPYITNLTTSEVASDLTSMARGAGRDIPDDDESFTRYAAHNASFEIYLPFRTAIALHSNSFRLGRGRSRGEIREDYFRAAHDGCHFELAHYSGVGAGVLVFEVIASFVARLEREGGSVTNTQFDDENWSSGVGWGSQTYNHQFDYFIRQLPNDDVVALGVMCGITNRSHSMYVERFFGSLELL